MLHLAPLARHSPHIIPLYLQTSPGGALAVAVASVISNYLESVLGATLQGRITWLTNDVINVIQITLGAGLAIALAQHWM